MTEKTTLQQIKTLAYGALNTDDDQEQFSKLMEIIELTDDTPPFAVGEYYSYKSMENVLHILKITAVMGDIVEAGFLDTETGKLINTRIELDKKYVQPAIAEQIAEFKKAKIKNDIDFIIKDGDGDWIEIVENIQDYLQTAEELQGMIEND